MAAIVIETADGLPTFDETMLKRIWSWLDPDGATPGTHRAVARWCVGDPVQLKCASYKGETVTESSVVLSISLPTAHSGFGGVPAVRVQGGASSAIAMKPILMASQLLRPRWGCQPSHIFAIKPHPEYGGGTPMDRAEYES